MNEYKKITLVVLHVYNVHIHVVNDDAFVCLINVGLLYYLWYFSPKKIYFSSSDSYPLFINNRSWKRLVMRCLFIHLCGSTAEKKVVHRLIDIRVCYIWCCGGDIDSLPGPIRQNTRRDSSLTCRGVKLFHQNARGLHAKLNLITVFLRGRDIAFLTLCETHT